jgi:hypothetical protein
MNGKVLCVSFEGMNVHTFCVSCVSCASDFLAFHASCVLKVPAYTFLAYVPALPSLFSLSPSLSFLFSNSPLTSPLPPFLTPVIFCAQHTMVKLTLVVLLLVLVSAVYCQGQEKSVLIWYEKKERKKRRKDQKEKKEKKDKKIKR